MHDISLMTYAEGTATPWHGLGSVLPRDASLDEICVHAGFYEALEKDLVVLPDLRVPDRKALVRSDDGRYIATVSRSGYAPIQFRTLAATVLELGREAQVDFSTAGTLGPAGARAWFLGELRDPLVIPGDPSPIRKYVLATSSHGGDAALALANVATRVVCANTLGVALAEHDGARWSVAHRRGAELRLAEAARGMRRVIDSYARLGELGTALIRTPFTDAQLATVLDAALPMPDDERDHPRITCERENVRRLFEEGIGIVGRVRGSAWAALNAAVQHADTRHTRAIRGRRADELRMESTLWGRSALMKQRAMQAITVAAGVRLAA